jgi:16S rRNA (uracil1498-N3)-methyltransferase
MKEVRFFFVPDAAQSDLLPPDEAAHCVRVLRLCEGDVVMLMDGRGSFYKAELTEATSKRVRYRITETLPQQPAWRGHLHLAMAPTKNMDRTEWLAEKATEIGLDELTFLDCQFSERETVKTQRIEKIVVAAVKQSRKAWMPAVNGMTRFADFVAQPRKGQKFIAHCYEDGSPKPFLLDVLDAESDATVLVGPEGDFSIHEVQQAVQQGYQPVSLGNSRLRTETAALVAAHLMIIKKMIKDESEKSEKSGDSEKSEFPEFSDISDSPDIPERN